MNDFDIKKLPRELTASEDPNTGSKKRILDMMKRYPHDFKREFDINELKDEDFDLERQYQNRKDLANQLEQRLQDLDINNPLNESQKIWAGGLLNRVIADLIDRQ